MRRYWIPAFFSHELPPNQPLRGKLLGENLVAFRNGAGKIGLMDERCAHRRASLFFGRKEEDGIRCVFHGWKFDVDGRCVDRPAGAPDSGAALKAYPCVERAGLIWTFMGEPGTAPRFPRLDWTLVPDAHRIATRELRKSNWLHALEHDPGAPGAPPILLMPFHTVVKQGSMPDAASRANAWVPVDDRHCMVYTVHYSTDRAVAESELPAAPAPDGGPRADVRDYLYAMLEQSEPRTEDEDDALALDIFPLPLFPSVSAAAG
jgi:nitrite reductase/ring-hydroxylating ferredoxin subunit